METKSGRETQKDKIANYSSITEMNVNGNDVAHVKMCKESVMCKVEYLNSWSTNEYDRLLSTIGFL